MTVTSESARLVYEGNGATLNFDISFEFIDPREIVVTVSDPVTGAETTWVENTDYVVDITPGSEKIMALGGAPVLGTKIAIARAVPYTQPTDYQENDAFPAETHERALDRLAMQVQQIKDLVGRTVTLPVTSTVSGAVLPPPGAGMLLRWNAAGTSLEVVDIGQINPSDLPTVLMGQTADQFLVSVADGSGGYNWVNASPAEVRSVLGLGDLALKDELDDASLALSKIALGTAGSLLGYDAAGDAATVGAGTVGQVLTSNGPGLSPSMQDAVLVSGSRRYVSADQTIVLGGLITLAHGLGTDALLVFPYLICVLADNGYVPGDIIVYDPVGFSGASGDNKGHSLKIDAVNLSVRFGTTGYQLPHGTTGATIQLATASWKLRLVAIRYA